MFVVRGQPVLPACLIAGWIDIAPGGRLISAGGWSFLWNP